MNVYVIVAVILVVIFVVASAIFRNPYTYPQLRVLIDISGHKNVNRDNEIDKWLCTAHGQKLVVGHFQKIKHWEVKCSEMAEKSFLKSLRVNQYNEAKERGRKVAFKFRFTRNATKYKQENSVKTPYTVQVKYDEFTRSEKSVRERYNKLKAIGFSCTLKDYYSENQRKLMTPKLRKQIMERDKYTCQECGKVMRDQVGLHIDHKIPISKGGKSIPENLQVLCSKCNGKKSNKLLMDLIEEE